ncbi:hypothetical protein [Kocuria palustris]|uniref:hypothetical protein n=1 Tax=Kocuria palustris TaxID=71999 RepID=UPI0011A95DB0|nr:hypothetical protein [Kocuria palustris]
MRTRRGGARYRAEAGGGIRGRLLAAGAQGARRLSHDSRARTSAARLGAVVAFLLPSLLIELPERLRVESPEVLLLSSFAYLIAVVLVLGPGRRRLDELPTIASVLAMAVCLALAREADPARYRVLSEHWSFQGLHVFVVVLALRQRTAWAWGFLCITGALAATHGARSELGPLMGAAPLATVAAVLVIGVILIAEVERLLDRRREARALGASARTDDDAEQDTVSASIRRVHEVRRLAGGHLERIAYDSAPIEPEEVTRFRLVEAQLRDSIRGRSIASPELLEATRRARERGVSVDILDERGSVLPQRILRIVGEQAAAVLDAAQAGSVTIRAFTADDPTAVLIVHDPGHEDDDAVALEIAQGTGEVSEF